MLLKEKDFSSNKLPLNKYLQIFHKDTIGDGNIKSFHIVPDKLVYSYQKQTPC